MVLFILMVTDTNYVQINGVIEYIYSGNLILAGNPPPFFYPFSSRYRNMNFSVDGRMGIFKLSGEIQETKKHEQNRAIFNITGKPFSLSLGDMDISVGGLLLRKKRMRGVRSRLNLSFLELGGYYTRIVGESNHERIQGDGTKGPFRLEHYPVIKHSEIVFIDIGLQRKRLERNRDYYIDYSFGRITLKDSVLMPEEFLEIYYTYTTEMGEESYGGEIGIKPIKWLTIGGGYVKNGGYTVNMGINTTFAEMNIEQATGSNGSVARSINGNAHLGPVSISSRYYVKGENFRPIGEELDGNSSFVGNGILTMEKGQLKFSYTERFGEVEKRLLFNYGNFSYTFSKYIGIYTLLKHTLMFSKKINALKFNIELSHNKHDSLANYGAGSGIEFRGRKYGVNLKGSYKYGDFTESDLDANIWLVLNKGFRLSLKARRKDSDIYPQVSLLNLSIGLNPYPWINTSGKYTIEGRRRELVDGNEPGERHVLDLSFSLRPFNSFSIRVRPFYIRSKGLQTGATYELLKSYRLTGLNTGRVYSISYSLENKKNYSLGPAGEKTQDNRMKTESIGINYNPVKGLILSGGYKYFNGSGLFRILIPVSADSAGDTVYLYRNELRITRNVSVTLNLNSSSRLSLNYSNSLEKLEIPDSLPLHMREHKMGLSAGIKLPANGDIMDELYYKIRSGFEPYVAGSNHVRYYCIGDEINIFVRINKGISVKLYGGVEQEYGEIHSLITWAGSGISGQSGSFFINLRGQLKDRSYPESRTLKINLTTGLRF